MIDVLCVGHASFDITMTTAHHPGADEKMLADEMKLGGGGPAANAAVQVARLGGRAAFCGYLGHDLFGEEHAAELAHEGVDIGLLVRGGHPSPVSQILAKPDGRRSVVNFKGDTPWLAEDAVATSHVEVLAPRVVLFDGHEPLLSASICDWARDKRIPTVLDAGSLHRGTRELAGRVDYLVASAAFAASYCATPRSAAWLGTLGRVAPNVVVTLGEQGLIWQRGSDRGTLAGYRVHAVDSTGAGDAFHGAFALAVARDMGWSETLALSSAAGGLACTRLGARPSLCDSTSVLKLMQQPL